MRLSIATVTLGGTLEQKVDAIAAAGFRSIEIFAPDLATASSSPAEIGRRLADHGVAVDLYQPLRDFDAVPEAGLPAALERADQAFEVMEALGASTLLMVSSELPEAVDDDTLAAQRLHLLGDLAAERGYRVAYEALAWGRHVNDYRHAWRLVELADHPQVGICLDSFHMFALHDDLAPIRDLPGEKVFAVQLADAPPQGDRELIEWSRHHRRLPPGGSFDLGTFCANVAATGYDGTWSLEVFSDALRAAAPDRVALDAMASLHSVLPRSVLSGVS